MRETFGKGCDLLGRRWAVVSLLAVLLLGWWVPGPSGVAQAAPAGRGWALLVGIDTYDRSEITPLQYAERDVQEVARALEESCGFSKDRVFVLTGSGKESLRATRPNLVDWLVRLRENVGPDDTFIFYFAGHGVSMDKENFLLTVDSVASPAENLQLSALRLADLTGLLERLPAARVLVAVDACRNDPLKGRGQGDNLLEDRFARDLVLSGPGGSAGTPRLRATLFACSPGERAWEWPEKRQGFFSYYLARGLRGEADDGRGQVTLASLVDYLDTQVPEKVRIWKGTALQRPWARIVGAGASKWVLALAPARPSAPPAVVSRPSTPAAPSAPAARPPVVSISAPSAGQKVTGDRVTLAASVSGGGPLSEVSVSVDGRAVSGGVRKTSAGAVVNVSVPVEEGEHTLVVSAVSEAGLPGQAAVTVVRERKKDLALVPGGGSLASTPAPPRPTSTPARPPRPSPTPAPVAANVQPPRPPTLPSGVGPGEKVNAKDGTVLLLVPAGPFTMGSNDGDSDEKPPHTVNLPAYYMGKTEVTNEQFRRFVGETGYRTTAEEKGSAYVWTGSAWEEQKGASWQTFASKSGDQAPVVCVSWNDAQAYCRWAGLRLPTEAEWEKAARGPEGRKYPWGDSWDASRAWCRETSGGQAHPVGTKPSGASPYGCLDMAGNVWEWTSSLYKSYPYSAGDGRENPGGSGARVLRGGSWLYYYDRDLRGADRLRSSPTTASSTTSGFVVRCSALPGPPGPLPFSPLLLAFP